MNELDVLLYGFIGGIISTAVM